MVLHQVHAVAMKITTVKWVTIKWPATNVNRYPHHCPVPLPQPIAHATLVYIQIILNANRAHWIHNWKLAPRRVLHRRHASATKIITVNVAAIKWPATNVNRRPHHHRVPLPQPIACAAKVLICWKELVYFATMTNTSTIPRRSKRHGDASIAQKVHRAKDISTQPLYVRSLDGHVVPSYTCTLQNVYTLERALEQQIQYWRNTKYTKEPMRQLSITMNPVPIN